MVNTFLENLGLKKLLSPVSEGEFHSVYWERAPLIVNRTDPEFYAGLFTLSDFDRVLSTKTNTVRVAGGKTKEILKYSTEIIAPSLERILSDMSEGATLILDSLNEHEPTLGLLCRLLEKELNHRFRTDIFLTAPSSQAFIPHYDKNDFFVLQVLGSKHWSIEKRRREIPESKLGFGPQDLTMNANHDSFTLNQGDLAYIPRGFVHTARTDVETSLHITLAMAPFTWGDLLHSAVNSAIQTSEELRRALPLGFIAMDTEILMQNVPSAIREFTNDEHLRAATESFKDDLVAKFPLDASGQFESFYSQKILRAEDRVGPRPGIICTIRSNDEGVTLRYGSRKIIFPAFLNSCIEFALQTNTFKIIDLPGDLEPGEKIVFAERLLQEGVLVRK